MADHWADQPTSVGSYAQIIPAQNTPDQSVDDLCTRAHIVPLVVFPSITLMICVHMPGAELEARGCRKAGGRVAHAVSSR